MNVVDEAVVFKKGHVIFAEGERSTYLYIVKTGQVRIFKESKGRLIPISVIGAQDFIGELSMFSEDSRSASAIATEETELVLVRKSDIRKVLKNCPNWVSNIMMTLSERLRSTVNILREHRIVDDLENSFDELSSEKLVEYMKLIEDYKSRRGIK